MYSEEPEAAVIVLRGSRPEPKLTDQIESRGIKVLWARTIKEVRGLLSPALDRTVVITELALRDGNWRDVVEQVRRINSSIPVLLVSSTSTAELWWDALECGIEDILPSPLSASSMWDFLSKRFQNAG